MTSQLHFSENTSSNVSTVDHILSAWFMYEIIDHGCKRIWVKLLILQIPDSHQLLSRCFLKVKNCLYMHYIHITKSKQGEHTVSQLIKNEWVLANYLFLNRRCSKTVVSKTRYKYTVNTRKCPKNSRGFYATMASQIMLTVNEVYKISAGRPR